MLTPGRAMSAHQRAAPAELSPGTLKPTENRTRERLVFLDRNTIKLTSFHLKWVCPQATANNLHFRTRLLKQVQNISA